MTKDRLYDLVVIGGGPAGYTAALYAARAGLRTLVLERLSAGGQMTETPQIDNYPGFDEGIDGFTLGFKMQAQAERFGAVSLASEVLSVSLASSPKRIVTDSGEFFAIAVIIATGAVHRHLGLTEEEALLGRGVGYCAACDGMLFRGKTVAVVGGGNSAVGDALLLSNICQKVYLIHRRDTLRAEKAYQAPLEKAKNLVFKWNATVKTLLHTDKLTGVVLEGKNGEEETLALDGLFISIGRSAATALFQNQLALDENGYIIAGEDTKTSLAGVYAVGDVRTKPFRQIVTAAADGAVAAHFAEAYVAEQASQVPTEPSP